MVEFILRRLFLLVITLLVASVIVFLVLELDIYNVAVKVLGPFSTEEQRNLWLEENGYFRPAYSRYFSWLGHVLMGDFGVSTLYKEPVMDVLLPRLGATALLGFISLVLIVVFALILGVLAGMRQGSWIDRLISFFTVTLSSLPEFATAVFFSLLFVYQLKILPGTSSMITGFNVKELILPVLVVFFYGVGYLARITRASMIEVMESHYVRTAFMKGVPFQQVIIKHALRNALVAPVTVIFLLLPWLLSGLIVVETFFAYKGFGYVLVEASLYDDVYMIQACTIVSVLVVVCTQFLSDLAYMWLNPRISFAGQGNI